MLSQGDRLMERKLQRVLEKQKSATAARSSASNFTFAQQFGSTGEDEISDKPPDNWQEPVNSNTGTYFREKHRTQFAPRATPQEPQQQQQQQHKLAKPPKERRKTPAERQAELDMMVAGRVLLGLEEQRKEAEDRLNVCRTLRDVERLKLTQRAKARQELQKACQGGEAGSTAVREQREQMRNYVQQHFIAHNSERMERNAMHRDYCKETLRQRANNRKQLESLVGTHFSLKKSVLLSTVGISGHEATVSDYPTPNELHKKRVWTAQQAEKRHIADEEKSKEVEELTAIDDRLWEQRRQQKGQHAKRVRELPYSTSAPHRQADAAQLVVSMPVHLPSIAGWDSKPTVH